MVFSGRICYHLALFVYHDFHHCTPSAKVVPLLALGV